MRLEFFEAGGFRSTVKGWVHRKTVPYTILVHAREGAYEVRQGDRRGRAPAGRVVVVPAHAPVEFTHRDGPRGVMESRWLHLRYSLWGASDMLGRYDIPLVLGEEESRAIARLTSDALAAGALTDDARLIRHHEIAASVLGILTRERSPRPDALSRKSRWGRRDIVLAYIGDNLAAPLAGEQLARLAGLSTARFYAVFKEELGVTPMQYVRALRVESAARQLVGTDLKLAQVAEASGFADAFHLSHVFKAHHGVSPKEYRRRAKRVCP